MLKYYKKVRPANLALFVYVSTHCVELVKQIDFNRYVQLTRWPTSNTPDCGARGPRFNSRLLQIQEMYIYVCFLFRCFCCCVVVFRQITLFIYYLAISFCIVNLFSILIIQQQFVTDYKRIDIQT